ncbi:MAG: hypothetical protein AAB444_01170 [Patescibacteria group bacterium]
MPNRAEHLTEKQIRFGLWWAKYKGFLKTATIAVLAVVNVLLWGKVVYTLFDYGVLSARREQALERSLVQGGLDWPTLLAGGGPLALEWSPPSVLASSRGSDVVSQVENRNPGWLARFHSRVLLGDQVSEADDFLLPGNTKYIFASFPSARGAPSFNITDVRWERVTPADAEGDATAFVAARANFAIEKAEFLPPAEGLPSRVGFEAVNQAAYSFWEPRFIVLLWRGSSLAGIQRTVMNQFRAGERRSVEINLIDRLTAVSRVEVIPDVNVFDSAAYMPPAGETQ